MLEAYLSKPGTLNDVTGIPQGDYTQGKVVAVNDRNGQCQVHTVTERYLAHPPAWKVVRSNEATGDMWLDAKPGEFLPGTGECGITIPKTLVGKDVYFRPYPMKRKNKLGAIIKVQSIVLAHEYLEARGKLIDELHKRKRAFETSTVYEVELLFRRNGETRCDPVQKRFVTPVIENRETVFRGSDLNVLRSMVFRHWPSTWAKEILVYDLGPGGTARCMCEVAPWDNTLRLMRVDRLVTAKG